MRHIHVINNNVGGVAAIVNRLVGLGDCSVSSNLMDVASALVNHANCEIHFHQPRSHALCLFFSIFGWNNKKRFTCILHESSDYTKGVTTWFRFLLGSGIRLFVIYANKKLGVRILGVSEFVLASYKIKNGKKISYVGLFRNDLTRIIELDKPRPVPLNDSSITVWVRRGDCTGISSKINLLVKCSLASNLYLFGDEVEIQLIISYLRKRQIPIFINENKSHIERNEFLNILVKSTWFISSFKSEGFGLSVFEAISAGCVCIVPKSGALIEWVPLKNYLISDALSDNPSKISITDLQDVSLINKRFAECTLGMKN